MGDSLAGRGGRGDAISAGVPRVSAPGRVKGRLLCPSQFRRGIIWATAAPGFLARFDGDRRVRGGRKLIREPRVSTRDPLCFCACVARKLFHANRPRRGEPATTRTPENENYVAACGFQLRANAFSCEFRESFANVCRGPLPLHSPEKLVGPIRRHAAEKKKPDPLSVDEYLRHGVKANATRGASDPMEWSERKFAGSRAGRGQGNPRRPVDARDKLFPPKPTQRLPLMTFVRVITGNGAVRRDEGRTGDETAGKCHAAEKASYRLCHGVLRAFFQQRERGARMDPLFLLPKPRLSSAFRTSSPAPRFSELRYFACALALMPR